MTLLSLFFHKQTCKVVNVKHLFYVITEETSLKDHDTQDAPLQKFQSLLFKNEKLSLDLYAQTFVA